MRKHHPSLLSIVVDGRSEGLPFAAWLYGGQKVPEEQLAQAWDFSDAVNSARSPELPQSAICTGKTGSCT